MTVRHVRDELLVVELDAELCALVQPLERSPHEALGDGARERDVCAHCVGNLSGLVEQVRAKRYGFACAAATAQSLAPGFVSYKSALAIKQANEVRRC